MILEGGPCPRAGPCCAWRRPTRSGRRTSAALTARPFLFGLDQCKMPDFHCLVPAKASHLNIRDRRFYGLGLYTFSLALICLSFLLAKTWMWDETCLRVLVFPVRNLMYLAISSFLPVKWGYQKLHFLINQVKDLKRLITKFMYYDFFWAHFWASC